MGWGTGFEKVKSAVDLQHLSNKPNCSSKIHPCRCNGTYSVGWISYYSCSSLPHPPPSRVHPLTWSIPQLLTLAKIATFWCLTQNANSRRSGAYGTLKLAPLSCHFSISADTDTVPCICWVAGCVWLQLSVCVCVCWPVRVCLAPPPFLARVPSQALVKVNFTLCQAALYSFFSGSGLFLRACPGLPPLTTSFILFRR